MKEFHQPLHSMQENHNKFPSFTSTEQNAIIQSKPLVYSLSSPIMLGSIQNIDGLHQLQILPLVLSPGLKFDTPMHAEEAVCPEESGTWSV